MGDLKHLLSLALLSMEFTLEKPFYFYQIAFYAKTFFFSFEILGQISLDSILFEEITQ